MRKLNRFFAAAGIGAAIVLSASLSAVFFEKSDSQAQAASTIVQPMAPQEATQIAAVGSSTLASQVQIVGSPVHLDIPAINVHVRVDAMGMTTDGQMSVPNNFTDVGWYALGTKPGEIGSAVMGAHVDNGSANPTINGVFKDLHELRAGDDIYVSDSNGSTLHFQVVSAGVYRYNTKNTEGVFNSTSGHADLNLITCYGKWLSSAGTYNERLVVFARLVQ